MNLLCILILLVSFAPLLNEVKTLTASETGIQSILQKADAEAKELCQ